MTERFCARQEAEQYHERLSLALKAAKICVFEVDLTKQLYTFFENAEDIFGVSGDVILRDVQPFSQLSPEEYQKAASAYFSHADDAAVIGKAFASVLAGKPTTYRARMRAGGSDYLWCKLDVTPIVENGVPVRMIGVITDISEMNRQMDLLSRAANLDGFTGLCNKAYALTHIRQALEKADGRSCALVLMDLDHFKHINDTRGHDIGDDMLLTVSQTLRHSFRKTDMVGRFGGDEFILWIEDIPSRAWLAQKLQGLLRYSGEYGSCTASIGAAFYPASGTTYEKLLKNADQALYRAKQTHESYVFFEWENE